VRGVSPFTRTDTTAGFTRSTTSANEGTAETGAGAVWGAIWPAPWAMAGEGPWGRFATARAPSAAAPISAVARRARGRLERGIVMGRVTPGQGRLRGAASRVFMAHRALRGFFRRVKAS
jgi:hypothetical protein